MNQKTRLRIVLVLNVSLIAALILVGLAAHSVSVVAAAGDTAADSVALILGLIAVSVRDRSSHPRRWLAIPAVVVLLAGAWVLGASAANEDLHMRSVLLDTLADAAAAGTVAIAGAVIATTRRFYWLDPALALVISLVVILPASTLCNKAFRAIGGDEVDFGDD